jgi:hypothetical protein
MNAAYGFELDQSVPLPRRHSMSFLSTKLGQFTYFDLQLDHPVWGNKYVLDFGGNVGNILKDHNATIDHDKYWCIDVSLEAVYRGRKEYPQAHWIFYNRHNFAFNPRGIPALQVPDLGVKFDYILSYSVFTHIIEEEMLELVHFLSKFLADDGVFAFTFIDPHYKTWPTYDGNNLRWRLGKSRKDNPSLDIEQLLEKSKTAHTITFVNDRDVYIDNEVIPYYEVYEKKSFHTFYTAAYMQRLFPQARVLPPVNAEMQHCCMLRTVCG